MRAVVTAASAHDPGRAGDIVKYGTSLCTPTALARFEELSGLERALALRHLDAWGNKLLSGDVKRVRALDPLFLLHSYRSALVDSAPAPPAALVGPHDATQREEPGKSSGEGQAVQGTAGAQGLPALLLLPSGHPSFGEPSS